MVPKAFLGGKKHRGKKHGGKKHDYIENLLLLIASPIIPM